MPKDSIEEKKTDYGHMTVPSEASKDNAGQSSLPKDTVHCFPANPTQILWRRLISVFFILLFCGGIYFFLRPETESFGFVALAGIGAVVGILVFIQSFLITQYRVAIDYRQNEVVLRYMFRKLSIPFAEFDCREGEPDRSQKLLEQTIAGKSDRKRMYLILDNVNEDACYQTSSYDLVSVSDFLTLKGEAEQISQLFKAKERLLAEDQGESEEDQVSRIVSEAMAEKPKDTKDPANKPD